MDRETLIRRLVALGVPHTSEDLEKLLPQWHGYLNSFGRFPDLDPVADEPALIFRPEVTDGGH